MLFGGESIDVGGSTRSIEDAGADTSHSANQAGENANFQGSAANTSYQHTTTTFVAFVLRKIADMLSSADEIADTQ